MSDPITSAISDRICKHMNEDHGDAIVLYAKAFGNTPKAEAAQMISIDPQGMNLSALVKGEKLPIRIEFEQNLQDSEDAHQTLIAMVKQARQMSASANIDAAHFPFVKQTETAAAENSSPTAAMSTTDS